MQVIGLCRFSYPAVGGFQVEHATTDARRAYLYQPDRLAERFRLFEAVTLPGLKNQTDNEFDFVIVIGSCLPNEAAGRLRDLTKAMPQVRIVVREPDEHRSVMKAVLNEARGDQAKPCLQFRLDDDDAVAIDFVAGLRKAVAETSGLSRSHPCYAIDFNQGFLAEVQPESARIAHVYRNLTTAGLGMYIQGSCDLTVMNFAHQRMGRFMPVVSYPEKPMWVRSLNGFNDSPKAINDRGKLEPISPEQRTTLADRFGIDL